METDGSTDPNRVASVLVVSPGIHWHPDQGGQEMGIRKMALSPAKTVKQC